MTSEVRTRLNALRSSLRESKDAASNEFAKLRNDQESSAVPLNRNPHFDAMMSRIKTHSFAYDHADEIPTSANVPRVGAKGEILVS